MDIIILVPGFLVLIFHYRFVQAALGYSVVLFMIIEAISSGTEKGMKRHKKASEKTCEPTDFTAVLKWYYFR